MKDVQLDIDQYVGVDVVEQLILDNTNRYATSDRRFECLNITTDKCYENREWVWGYRENDPMGGYDPYSSSKGCAELVSSAYRQSFLESNGMQRMVAFVSFFIFYSVSAVPSQ